MSEKRNYVFLNGEAVENPHESHEHVTPLPVYHAVFGALLVLTVLTYLVSYADLGPGSLPVAMFVATIKASLVIGFFMHLKYEDRTFAFMFAVCWLFVSIFFTVTLFDMDKTGELNNEAGIEYYKSARDHAEALLNPPPAAEHGSGGDAGHETADH